MPENSRVNGAPRFVVGLDGARGGWALARLDLADGKICLDLCADFDSVQRHCRGASAIHIDMPIGLAETGRRACETMARAALGPRRSSVFPAPRRPMLAFETYAQANEWGKSTDPDGGGLSKQAWNLLPKIREIDAAMTPARQRRFREAHPELVFIRLIGTPCAAPKKTPAGAAERQRALTGCGIDSAAIIADMRRRKIAASVVAEDDIIDALALAVSARDACRGEAWRMTDGSRDGRGLVMEIWG